MSIANHNNLQQLAAQLCLGVDVWDQFHDALIDCGYPEWAIDHATWDGYGCRTRFPWFECDAVRLCREADWVELRRVETKLAGFPKNNFYEN